MKLEGNLHKMHTEAGSPVSYSLELGGQRLVLSDFIGERIRSNVRELEGALNRIIAGPMRSTAPLVMAVG